MTFPVALVLPIWVLLRGSRLEHPESCMPFRPSCVMSQQLSVLQEVHRDFSETYQEHPVLDSWWEIRVGGGRRLCGADCARTPKSGMEWERSSSVANSTGRNRFCTWILLPLPLYYFSTRRENFPSAPARARPVRHSYNLGSEKPL